MPKTNRDRGDGDADKKFDVKLESMNRLVPLGSRDH